MAGIVGCLVKARAHAAAGALSLMHTRVLSQGFARQELYGRQIASAHQVYECSAEPIRFYTSLVPDKRFEVNVDPEFRDFTVSVPPTPFQNFLHSIAKAKNSLLLGWPNQRFTTIHPLTFTSYLEAKLFEKLVGWAAQK